MTKPKASETVNRAKAPTLAPTPAPDPAKSKGLTLTLPRAAGRTNDELLAQVAADGIAGNAFALTTFGKGTFGELALTECALALKETAERLNGGDLAPAVTMLAAQAAALNAMFGELARRSALNMGEYLDASERYMRLALKAQGQCRATLETLAAIKNPPVVFARQANIAHGPQQVNNGAAPTAEQQPAHAANAATAPTELLELQHGERMDPGAASAASRADPQLAPVGEVDRPANE